MWRTLLFVIGLSAPLIGHAQAPKVDSILTAINEHRSTLSFEQQAEGYRQISEHYMHTMNRDSALLFARHSLLQDEYVPKAKLLGYNQLARVFHHFQEYDSATYMYGQAIDAFNQDSVGTHIGHVYINFGILQIDQGDLDASVPHLLKALDFADLFDDNNIEATALTTLAWTYMELEQFEKAEAYYLEALSDSLVFESEKGKHTIYRGLGLVYSRWGKFDQALEFALPALEYFTESGNKLYSMDMFSNVATIYYRMEEYQTSLTYELEALEIARELDHQYGISMSELNIAGCYIHLKRYSEAEDLLQSILLSIDSLTAFPKKVLELRSSTFVKLSEVYEAKNLPHEALAFFKKHKQISDSLITMQRDSKVTETESKYQTEKQKRENATLLLEKEQTASRAQKEKQESEFVQLALGSLLLITVFATLFIRQKLRSRALALSNDYHILLADQSTRIQEGKQLERDRISQELHCDITSDLTSIYLQLDRLKGEGSKEQEKHIVRLKTVLEKVRDLSHDLAENTHFKGSNLSRHISDLVELSQTPSLHFDYEPDEDLSSIPFSPQGSVTIFRIIQEALQNINKHSNASHALVRFNLKDNHIQITIKDNGSEAHSSKTEGQGLRTIRKRARSLNGDMKFLQDTGSTSISVTIPVKNLIL